MLYNIVLPTFWIHNLSLVSVKSQYIKNTVCCSCIVASWVPTTPKEVPESTASEKQRLIYLIPIDKVCCHMIDRNFLYFLELRIIINGSSQKKKEKNKNQKNIRSFKISDGFSELKDHRDFISVKANEISSIG